MSHFINAIEHVDGGHAVEVADEQLAAILAAVKKTGKKGKVSIELEIGANGERGFEIRANVKATAPQVSFGKSFWYADRHGQLTRTPPAEEAAELIDLSGRK